nr:alpha/beta fold hydrolase [Geodermatophilus sabuli]
MARAFEAGRAFVSARDSWFIAALLYGGAQWPIFENNARNVRLDDAKTACYQAYVRHADRVIHEVSIPFRDTTLPAYLHMPPGVPAGTPVPAVLGISGMDSFKEMRCALYGDKLLQRGFAVLAIDGPGQGTALVRRGIRVTEDAFADVGRAAVAWLRGHPDVDGDRIAVFGASFGSFWATQVAAAVPDLAACAVAFVCHEPGLRTLFETASPTFKVRFMYMAGFSDEEEFDRWAAKLDVLPLAERVTAPYLAIAGEDDELSPVEHTYRLLDAMQTPKQMLVYEGESHGLHTGTSSSLGPHAGTYVADWLRARVDGVPMDSEHSFVDLAGTVQTRPWSAELVDEASER